MPTLLREFLVTGKVRGDHQLHLFGSRDEMSLCGLTRRPTSTVVTFRTAPCHSCLSSALDDGHLTARDGASGFTNLSRVPRQR